MLTPLLPNMKKYVVCPQSVIIFKCAWNVWVLTKSEKA